MNSGGSGNIFINLPIIKPISHGRNMQVTKYWSLSEGDKLWTKASICYTGVGFLIDCWG